MIYFPKKFGVCKGSESAIKLAFELKDKYKNKTIYIYKEILHNEYIIKELERNNIKTIDSLDNVTPNDILIIRAHGEPKRTYEVLNKKKITYYDATCVNVSKVHELAQTKYNEGYKIIIVGKKAHPEVIGTNGWIDDKGLIIESRDDFKELKKNTKYFVLCQTTISHDLFNSLIDYMTKENFDFDYKNTICNAQNLIQTSSVELAKKMDVMFIIGGQNSSNTKELYKLCSNVCKTHYFSDVESFCSFISKQKYTYKTKIGFSGGASTPKEQIYEYSNLLSFLIYYKTNKKEIEKEMVKFNNFIKKDNNPIINESLDYFKYANKDGKCIRGTLINLGYNTHKKDNYSMYLASAYESFETSILIHDDIIDNSDLRRGKPTIHKLYMNDFKDYKLDRTPYNLALCIGDLGFYYINDYLITKYKDYKNLTKLLRYYNQVVIDTAKGEVLDVYLPFVERNDKHHRLHEEDIMSIYRLKTSKYTIVGPFVLGLLLSGASNKEMKEFEKVLEPLGIAYQIKDDILGIFSNNDTIGKSVLSDIEEFKQTILYSYIKLQAPQYLDKLLNYYGKKISNKDLLEVQKIIAESGSLEYANNTMERLFNESKHGINNMKIKEEIKSILLGFIKYLEIRKK